MTRIKQSELDKAQFLTVKDKRSNDVSKIIIPNTFQVGLREAPEKPGMRVWGGIDIPSDDVPNGSYNKLYAERSQAGFGVLKYGGLPVLGASADFSTTPWQEQLALDESNGETLKYPSTDPKIRLTKGLVHHLDSTGNWRLSRGVASGAASLPSLPQGQAYLNTSIGFIGVTKGEDPSVDGVMTRGYVRYKPSNVLNAPSMGSNILGLPLYLSTSESGKLDFNPSGILLGTAVSRHTDGSFLIFFNVAASGLPGPAGAQGPSGPVGAQGPAGPQGESEKGEDGKDGKDGSDGSDGSDGKGISLALEIDEPYFYEINNFTSTTNSKNTRNRVINLVRSNISDLDIQSVVWRVRRSTSATWITSVSPSYLTLTNLINGLSTKAMGATLSVTQFRNTGAHSQPNNSLIVNAIVTLANGEQFELQKAVGTIAEITRSKSAFLESDTNYFVMGVDGIIENRTINLITIRNDFVSNVPDVTWQYSDNNTVWIQATNQFTINSSAGTASINQAQFNTLRGTSNFLYVRTLIYDNYSADPVSDVSTGSTSSVRALINQTAAIQIGIIEKVKGDVGDTGNPGNDSKSLSMTVSPNHEFHVGTDGTTSSFDPRNSNKTIKIKSSNFILHGNDTVTWFVKKIDDTDWTPITNNDYLTINNSNVFKPFERIAVMSLTKFNTFRGTDNIVQVRATVVSGGLTFDEETSIYLSYDGEKGGKGDPGTNGVDGIGKTFTLSVSRQNFSADSNGFLDPNSNSNSTIRFNVSRDNFSSSTLVNWHYSIDEITWVSITTATDYLTRLDPSPHLSATMTVTQFNRARSNGSKVFVRASVTEGTTSLQSVKEINLLQESQAEISRNYDGLELRSSRDSFLWDGAAYDPSTAIQFNVVRGQDYANNLQKIKWKVKKLTDVSYVDYSSSNLTVNTNIFANPGLNNSSMTTTQFETLRDGTKAVQVMAEIEVPRTEYDLNTNFSAGSPAKEFTSSGNLVTWLKLRSGNKPSDNKFSPYVDASYHVPQTIQDNLTTLGTISYAAYKSVSGNAIIINTDDTKKLNFYEGTTDLPFSISFWLALPAGTFQTSRTFLVKNGAPSDLSDEDEKRKAIYSAAASNRRFQYSIHTTAVTNTLEFRIMDSDSSTSSTRSLQRTCPISPGEICHLTFIYDPQGSPRLSIYKNGISIGTLANSGFTSMLKNTGDTSYISVGGNVNNNVIVSNSQYPNALISELIIFDKALSVDEALAIYNASNTGINTEFSRATREIFRSRDGQDGNSKSLTLSATRYSFSAYSENNSINTSLSSNSSISFSTTLSNLNSNVTWQYSTDGTNFPAATNGTHLTISPSPSLTATMTAGQFNAIRGANSKIFIRATTTENSATYQDTKEVNLETIPAPVLEILPSTTTFVFDSNGNAVTPNSVTLNAVLRNLPSGQSYTTTWNPTTINPLLTGNAPIVSASSYKTATNNLLNNGITIAATASYEGQSYSATAVLNHTRYGAIGATGATPYFLILTADTTFFLLDSLSNFDPASQTINFFAQTNIDPRNLKWYVLVNNAYVLVYENGNQTSDTNSYLTVDPFSATATMNQNQFTNNDGKSALTTSVKVEYCYDSNLYSIVKILAIKI